MKTIAEAADGSEAVALYRLHLPDVVLMDLRMPKTDGVAATQKICESFPDARVIALTTFDGDEDIYRALQSGARAYLLKGMNRHELLDAIRRVHKGERVIPQSVAVKLAERMTGNELTPRETDVLRLIVRGHSNRDIAGALKLTEGTIKSYVKNVLSKLGVEDRTQAAIAAVRRGIIHLE